MPRLPFQIRAFTQVPSAHAGVRSPRFVRGLAAGFAPLVANRFAAPAAGDMPLRAIPSKAALSSAHFRPAPVAPPTAFRSELVYTVRHKGKCRNDQVTARQITFPELKRRCTMSTTCWIAVGIQELDDKESAARRNKYSLAAPKDAQLNGRERQKTDASLKSRPSVLLGQFTPQARRAARRRSPRRIEECVRRNKVRCL